MLSETYPGSCSGYHVRLNILSSSSHDFLKNQLNISVTQINFYITNNNPSIESQLAFCYLFERYLTEDLSSIYCRKENLSVGPYYREDEIYCFYAYNQHKCFLNTFKFLSFPVATKDAIQNKPLLLKLGALSHISIFFDKRKRKITPFLIIFQFVAG